MIFGYIFSTVGYALFYWGVHHFPFVDGGERVSLLDCLGIPQAWGIARGQPVQLNPTGGITPPAQQQTPSNNKTPGGVLPKKQSMYGAGRGGATPPAQKPDCWQFAGKGALPMFTAWKNQKTGKTYYGANPPGAICPGSKNPNDCWVFYKNSNVNNGQPLGAGWKNRMTGKISMTINPPGPKC